MLTLSDGRSELWQWDTGRKLTVDADCSQVHFSNKVFGRSIDADVVDGVASIPDILLQTDKELTAWAFVGTPENGYTKISKSFKVNKRNKPADYVFTPPEQTTLDELVERLQKIEGTQDPDAIKNAVEEYLKQNPVAAPVQSVNGKTGKIKLTAEDVGAISQDKLQEATNEALAQAKASGEFDGKDGKDYVLTEADKQEIAQEAAELVEVPDVDIPTTLPNPNALTFTGAATGTYDGSAPLTVNIPEGGGGTGGGSGGMRLVRTLKLTEDATSVTINTDDDGNAFSLAECILYISANVTAAGKIEYIPNGYWVAGTFVVSSAQAATDYGYTFAIHSYGKTGQYFWGHEFISKGGGSGANYHSERANYHNPISSYRVNGSFAAGATFRLYGVDS